jgi:UDP-sulfoquinovose synthase
MFACRVWGLRATDVMQGIVYGTYGFPQQSDPRLWTRFDYDTEFGTIINRFCCQAIAGHPLTVYGRGEQRRSYLPISDSIGCLTLALDNPPSRGEYRVFNQFDRFTSVAELAALVQEAASSLGIETQITYLENLRCEAENHYYNPDRNHLLALGYQPRHNPLEQVKVMLMQLLPWKDRIEAHQALLIPEIHWDGSRRPAVELESRGITS